LKRCPYCDEEVRDNAVKCKHCGCDLNESRPRQADTAADEPMLNQPAQSPQAEPLSLRRADDPASTEQKQTVYLEKLKEAWSDGKLTVSQIQELTQLRQRLGISEAQANELREKAIESLRPVQRDDFEEKPRRDTSRGIALSINTNRFYMEGFSGVLDIELKNLGDNAFDNIKVEVSGELLGRNEQWSCRLESGEGVEKRFPVRPADAGVKLVQFRISARQGNSVYAYWAETDLPIFEKTRELQNISIQANKLVDFGSVSDNAKNMGNSVRNHIDNLLKIDKIHTANDLMIEYRKLPANFKMLRLTFDPDRSKQLTDSLKDVKKTGKGKRILSPERGSLTQVASLQLESKDKRTNIVLIARPKITLGKNRKNDIVTRILPRSEVNDNQSNQISRNHCRLELSETGVFVKDNHSVNGTLLDSKTVDANGRQIKANTKELELGGVLKMLVRCLDDKHGLNDAAYKKVINEPLGPTWETAAKTALSSITLERVNNLSVDDKNGFEKYCLVYCIATIGSAPHCSVSFANKGLELIHAAILYFGRRFYLENLSDLTDVVVNETTLSRNEMVPLSFGDNIRVARLNMTFVQKSQLFVGTLGAS